MKKIIILLFLQSISLALFSQNHHRLTGPRAKNTRPPVKRVASQQTDDTAQKTTYNVQLVTRKKRWIRGAYSKNRGRWYYQQRRTTRPQTASFPKIKVKR